MPLKPRMLPKPHLGLGKHPKTPNSAPLAPKLGPTMARRASFGYHNENKEPAMALFIYKEKKLDAPNIVASEVPKDHNASMFIPKCQNS